MAKGVVSLKFQLQWQVVIENVWVQAGVKITIGRWARGHHKELGLLDYIDLGPDFPLQVSGLKT